MEQHFPNPLLSVVMPCHNEIRTVEKIVSDWLRHLKKEIQNFELILINDGSHDGTGRCLDGLRKMHPEIRVIHQLRTGHEGAVRRGYEEARGEFIFQTDPTGCYEPVDFQRAWEKRLYYSLILGRRTHRLDGILRRTLSRLLKVWVYKFTQIKLQDSNAPFRLFKRNEAQDFLKRLPKGWTSVNVSLAIDFKLKYPNECLELDIPHRTRKEKRQRATLLQLARTAVKTWKELYWLSRPAQAFA